MLIYKQKCKGESEGKSKVKSTLSLKSLKTVWRRGTLCGCAIACGVLLSGCEIVNYLPLSKDVDTKVEVTKAFPTTFQVAGHTLSTNMCTYQEIVELIVIMVEEDVLYVEVPYSSDFMTVELYDYYAMAFKEAYIQVNTSHIEHTSNTSRYGLKLNQSEDGHFQIFFTRSDKDFSDDEILMQNQFFREEVTRLTEWLFETEKLRDDMEDLEKVKAIFVFVTEYLNYSMEIVPLSFTAYGAVKNQDVVCQGYTALFNALLKEIGFLAEGQSGTVGLGEFALDEGHIWSRVLVEEEWLYFDVTMGDRYSSGTTEGDVLYNLDYFNMSEDFMIRNRTVNRYGFNNKLLQKTEI